MEHQILNKYSKFNEVTDINLKNALLNIIYNNINPYHLKYKYINNYSQLEIIKTNKYLVTPHINGTCCLLIIVELYKQKYQCIINKKDIKYYKNIIDISSIKIYNFWINSVHSDLLYLYNLTILDGRFIIAEDNLNFILYNVYVLNGKNLHNLTIFNKFKMIDNILTLMNETLFSQFTIKLTTLNSLQELEYIIFDKIKNSKLKINGIIFLSEKNEVSFFYINDIEFNYLRNQSPKIEEPVNLDLPVIAKSIYDDVQLDENTKCVFVCKTTNIPDVFELYRLINKNEIYNNISSSNRIGIAHIPNISISQYCKKRSTNTDIFINNCIYNKKFNKWTPIVEII